MAVSVTQWFRQGPTAIDAATQRCHFGFPFAVRLTSCRPMVRGADGADPLSGTWETSMAPNVMPGPENFLVIALWTQLREKHLLPAVPQDARRARWIYRQPDAHPQRLDVPVLPALHPRNMARMTMQRRS